MDELGKLNQSYTNIEDEPTPTPTKNQKTKYFLFFFFGGICLIISFVVVTLVILYLLDNSSIPQGCTTINIPLETTRLTVTQHFNSYYFQTRDQSGNLQGYSRERQYSLFSSLIFSLFLWKKDRFCHFKLYWSSTS